MKPGKFSIPSKTDSPAGASVKRSENRLAIGICVLLALAVFAVFGQTLHYGFVNYDDDEYVYENPFVQKGLTWVGIHWAFTGFHSANWHPLTWLSHMLDCQLYGLTAGGHHFTNVLIHAATAIVLFLVLRRMTGFLWRSAFVAAVFAIHPLRAESVAWVAERKDVLSGLFFMLTVGAYVRYAQRPWSAVRYGRVLLLFALGLMCKPMLVTLPLVLLLLDYWPLRRIAESRIPHSEWKRLLMEKIPFLVLAAVACVITFFAQTESVESTAQLTPLLRVENAMASCVIYLGQMFWPSGLAVLYPFAPGGVGMPKAILSLAVLSGISAAVVLLRRRCPCFLTGWLWYLVMLAPVIGIVQVGLQTHADRYTYLPQIGLYWLLTWAVADLSVGWRHRQAVLAGASAVILAALFLCARKQASYWRNSETLWTHTLACTSDNPVACYDFGNALLQTDAVDEAIARFQRALQLDPGYAEAHNNLGNALLQKGAVDEAIAQFQNALQINPGLAVAHYDLGIALLRRGAVNDAIFQYQQALQINPDYADAHNNLGNALLQKGAVDDAITHFQTALQINPDYADAHNNLGNALLQKGAVDDAITHFQTALQIKPRYAEAHYDLGNALFRKGNVDGAILQYQQALQLNPDYAKACNNLGFALLQKGNVAEAISHYQKALQINPDFADAENNLAWLLATSPQASLRNGSQAVQLARRANQLAGDGNPIFLDTLAAAFAESGQFPEAVETAQRALQLAETQSNTALADAIRLQLNFYQTGVPFHLQ
jgi:tetratricopeptide (TPR) repeat protein